MREILFRAKRIDRGEWIEGYYCKWKQIRRYLGSVKEKVVDCIITWMSDGGMSRYEIDPETLCQYTGLKDKNGNRIWENDIVRIENSMDEGIGNIEFYGGIWYMDGEPSNSLYDIVEYDDADIEVIGNIFDNPEMMKEQ